MSEVSIVGPNGEANEIKEEVHSSDERDRHISPPASSRQEAARLEIEQAVIHSKNAVNTDDPNETPDLIFDESGGIRLTKLVIVDIPPDKSHYLHLVFPLPGSQSEVIARYSSRILKWHHYVIGVVPHYVAIRHI